MAPMIDMVFLLLVFFMTASAMSQVGNRPELELPESPESTVAEEFSGRIVVSIDPAGRLFLGSREVELDELAESLRSYRKLNAGAKTSIRAAKDTPFASVRLVMEASVEAGIQDCLYATYQIGAQ